MTYKSYEARIRRIAAVTKGLRKWAPLIVAILLTAVLATGGYLVAKGMVIGGVTCPPVLEYGDDINPTSFVVMGSAVYEYAAEGEDVWSQTPPVLPGKYQVRAVTTRSFGIVDHSRVTPFVIQPRKVTVTVTEDSIPYGGTPTISVELSFGDRVETVSLEFENLEISPNTPVHISKETIRIVNVNGEDVTSAYELNTVDKIVAVVPRPITLSSESAAKVYDGTALSAPRWALKEGTLMEGDTLEVVLDRSVTYVSEGNVENSASTLVIKNAKGQEVTNFYAVTTEWGTLSIQHALVSVATEDKGWQYGDSKPNYGQLQLLETPLPAGHTHGGTPVEVPAAPGQYTNLWNVTILDGAGKDVTDNFIINEDRADHENWGSITVSKRQLAVTTRSETREYNGTPLSLVPTDKEGIAKLFDDQMPTSNHTVIVDESTVTYVYGCGEAENVFKIRIYDGDGEEVTETHYEIAYTYGKLAVTPYVITEPVTTFNGELIYNYGPQSYTDDVIEYFYMNNQGFPDGHTVEIDPDTVTTLTDVGEVENTCQIRIRDVVGNDVTDCFTFTYSYGTLKIVPLAINIAPQDKIGYFGEPLRADTAIDVDGILPEGYTIEAEFDGVVEIFNGVVENGGGTATSTLREGTVKIKNTTGADVTANYDVNCQEGYLSVFKRPITIAPSYKETDGVQGHAEPIEPTATVKNEKKLGVTTFSGGSDDEDDYIWKYYDGTPLEPGEIEIVEMEDSLQLPDGFVIQADISGSQTLVGKGEVSSIVNFTIFYDVDGDGEYDAGVDMDCTDCFQVASQTRKLEVKARPITISTPAASFPYNAQAQSMTVEALRQALEATLGAELAALPDPHTFEIISEPTSITFIKDNGRKNEVTVRIYNSRGEDVTEYFDITNNFGDLTITPVELTIIPQSVTKVYDGRPLNGAGRYKLSGSLPGHKLEVPEDPTGELFATITDVGTAQSWFPKHGEAGYYYKVTYGGEDVTDNFTILVDNDKEKAGWLEITPRILTLDIENMITAYNGEVQIPSYGVHADSQHTLASYKETIDGVEYRVVHVLISPNGYRDVTTAAITFAPDDFKVYRYRYKIVNDVQSETPEAWTEADDVTKNYQLEGANGSLTIQPARYELTLESYDGMYDGLLHFVGANHPADGEGSLFGYYVEENGQRYHVVPALEGGFSEKNVCSMPNIASDYRIVGYKYKVVDGGDGDLVGTLDLTGNYDLFGADGALVIHPISITIESYGATRPFDGTALFNHAWNLSGALAPNQELIVQNFASILFVGETANTFSYSVLDENGEDVTGNYDVTTIEGVLKVEILKLTVTTADDSKIYDGTPLYGTFDHVTVVGLPDTLSYTVDGFTSIINVDTYGVDNICELTLWCNGYEVTSDQYEITYEFGKLVVFHRQITIRSDSASRPFDGTPLSAHTVTVVEGTLADGQRLIASDFPSITFVGLQENTFSFEILNQNGDPVTDNYQVTDQTGDLEIRVLYLNVTTQSVSKPYDGTPLTGLPAHVTVDGLPGTLTFRADGFASITLVNESGVTNVCTVTLWYNDSQVDPSQYSISYEFGSLIVLKRSVTVTTPDAEKEYDGTALITSPDAVTADNLVPGHRLYATSDAVNAYVGTEINSWSIVICDENGHPVTEQYDITYVFGTLSITSREIVVTTIDYSKIYDGLPLLVTPDSITVTKNGFLDPMAAGHTYILLGGHYDFTEIGAVTNECSIIIFNADGVDVTGQHAIRYAYGTLEIFPRDITVTTPDSSKEYDGEPLFTDPDQVVADNLATGHRLYATPAAANAYVGTEINSWFIRILDDGGNDVTEQYNITTQFGMLEITPRAITVTTVGETKMYDGNALIATTDSISISNMVLSHIVFFEGGNYALIDCDVVTNKCTVTVWNEYGLDVTENFAITYDFGTLAVTPRPFSISTPSAEKIFDGTPLTFAVGDAEYSLLSDGFRVELIGVSSVAENRIIYPGSMKNEIHVTIYNVNDEDVTRNFAIEANFGTLVIKPCSVQVTTPTLSKEYDGTPLVSAGGDATVEGLPDGFRMTFGGDVTMTDVGTITNDRNVRIFDQNDNDVTEMFSITTNYGRMTVTPRKLIVTTPDSSKEFDESPLLADGSLVTVQGLLDGHVFVAQTYAAITNPGSMKNTLDSWSVTCNGVDVTRNYVVDQVLEGTLTVTPPMLPPPEIPDDPDEPIRLVVTPHEITIPYDGKPHGSSGDAYFISEGYLPEGYTITDVLFTDQQTDVGEYTTSILNLVIRNELGEDVTATEFVVEFGTSKLIIQSRTLTVTTPDVSKTYDGTPLSSATTDILVSGLADGHVANVTDMATLMEIGEIENSCLVTVVDEYGRDVTEMYALSYRFGSLAISEIPLHVQTPSLDKEYDGTPLVGDALDVTVDMNALLAGHSFTASGDSAITEIGFVDNVWTVSIVDELGNDVTHLYDISYEYGLLTVNHRRLSVTTATHEKTYDGLPLMGSYDDILVEGLLANHVLMAGGFKDITQIGSVLNDCTIMVMDELGNDVTALYSVAAHFGRLTVSPILVTVTTPSLSKIYDGTALISDPTLVQITGLQMGHYAMVSNDVSITEIGFVENVCTVSIYDENGVDVTDQYEIHYDFGTLAVTLRTLMLWPDSIEVTYDGLCHVPVKFYIVEGTLPDGYTVADVQFSAQPKDVGIHNVYITSVTILNELGEDVTAREFQVTGGSTLVTINPRPITVTTPTDSKIYDSTPLFSTKEEIIVSTLLPGHTFQPVSFASITEIGSITNECWICILDENGVDVTDQYDIQYYFGTLTVKKRNDIPLSLQPYEMEVTYDGMPHGPVNGSDEYWILDGELPDGYTITNVLFTEQQVKAGVYQVKIVDLTILNEYGEDVTYIEFDLEFVPANLTIRTREIDIETASLSVRFDGYEHYDFSYEILGGTLVSGHTIEIVMSTKVRDYVPNQVTYNTVDSFVIRDADGNEVFKNQSGEPHEFKTGVDENGAPYVYESFGVDGENYLITIRYGTLNITYRK